ncbi:MULTISPECIES: DUF2569 domain-containing protein [Pontibacillus]|uniref:DUF2569 domain-containing protein n=1 Tax=Pontibacillus chungwhensis TaxID=265426 RepID=A0ABY8V208_9BACI|nr:MULTISPECIES: DUF2569 domain-containing protein [Pontibacillus]MCD5322224.1 DUF2569 domain-containing protein [Pontibacillus sp. HN14]WIF99518.1 DUF2569 domain-containing protein [Pontibacillus chungwhensis]
MDTNTTPDTTLEEYDHINGWLILVAMGLIFSIVGNVIKIFTTFLPLFEEETWSEITTKGTDLYAPFLGTTIIVESIVQILLLGFTIFLAVMFFKKHRLVPKLMIYFYIIALVLIVIDNTVAFAILQESEFGQIAYGQLYPQLFGAIIGACIWIPYFLKSKRVKLTFTQTWKS